jgi:glycosyltransferase involved in cell wall biosynthesis
LVLNERSHPSVKGDMPGDLVTFSIVIPARNEERWIGGCLESIRVAAQPYPGQVEIIVVVNRCSDRTEEIARTFGSLIVREDARNLAIIRNAGARSATGKILITVDADSTITPNTLVAIERSLASGTTVGGGTFIRPERLSAGIVVTLIMLALVLLIDPISGGLFWCYRDDFNAIGGFNTTLVSAEDVDFARRLKAYGKRVHRPFSTLRGGHIITSCRKLDQFGDWYILKNLRFTWRLLRGTDQRAANEFYYDVER